MSQAPGEEKSRSLQPVLARASLRSNAQSAFSVWKTKRIEAVSLVSETEFCFRRKSNRTSPSTSIVGMFDVVKGFQDASPTPQPSKYLPGRNNLVKQERDAGRLARAQAHELLVTVVCG